VSRRVLVVGCLILLGVAGGVFVLLRGGADEQQAGVADPLAEALGYAPAAAPVVVQFEVQRGSSQGTALRDLARTFPAARFAADGVRGAARGLGFDADADLPSLLGGPLVAWGPPDAITSLTSSVSALQLELAPVLKKGVTAAVVGRSAADVAAVLDRATSDGRLRKLADLGPGIAQYALPGDAGRLGVRDADLVLGARTATLQQAFALRDRQGGLTRATFEQRLGPLAAQPALIRATLQPRALLSGRAGGVAWVDALRGGALAVRIEKPGIRLRVHFATDPTNLAATDLPLASGVAPPEPAPGTRGISGGVRGLSQTIHVLDAAKGRLNVPFLKTVTDALSTLDSVKGPLKTFGGIDVDAALIDQLTGTTTITPEAPGTLALRAELRDGGPLRTALDRIAAVPDVALKLAGVTDLNLAHLGADAYAVTRGGTPFLHLAVLGTTLVVTDDLRAGLRAIAARRPERVARPAGALAFHADGHALQDELVRRLGLPDLARLVLGGFGDVNGSARAERTGVDLDATLTLNQ
jgi:hypothetical protein